MHAQGGLMVALAVAACVKIALFVFLDNYLVLLILVFKVGKHLLVPCFNNIGPRGTYKIFCLCKTVRRGKHPYHFKLKLLHFYNGMLLVLVYFFASKLVF